MSSGPQVADSGDRVSLEPGQSYSIATKSYRVRLRKLDSQSVIMGGLLPVNSTLQTIADEIVILGHADAGTFSIVFPKLQNHPSIIFEPNMFDTSLESCGVFESHMTLTLQRFVQPPPPKRWSPPPPLVRGTAPRGRIDAQKVRHV